MNEEDLDILDNLPEIENVTNFTNLNNENDEALMIIGQNNSKIDDLKIHMFKQSRGKKSDTIIAGLKFNGSEESKQFLTAVKKKFGVGGCQKDMPEISTESVFVFTGDLREKIKKFLINDYQKNEDVFKMHG